MNAALKAALIAAPVLLVLLALRACAQDEAERWLARAREVDRAARLVVDEEELIVVAPGREWERVVREELLPFRAQLIERHGDLLGRPAHRRMVVVVFTDAEQVRAYGGPRLGGSVHGYSDGVSGALFVPAEADRSTLRHETVHWIMQTAVRGQVQYSPWLSEGLAQLFETDPPGSFDEKRRRGVRLLLGEGVRLDHLLALQDYALFVGRDGPRHYMEALVLTAFLYRERPRERLERYAAIERETPAGRETWFRRVYAVDRSSFRRDLGLFVQRLRAPG